MPLALLFVTLSIFSTQAIANSYPYSNWPNYGYDQQGKAKQNSFGEWKNWMQNNLNGKNWQQGDGNIFQDAKGFYKLLGSGKTKWKFYFDVDFQLEMDAWLKGQGKSNTNNRYNQYYNQNQYWNQQGQMQPNYNYGGQGYYQGYGYPQGSYYNYPYNYPSYAPNR